VGRFRTSRGVTAMNYCNYYLKVICLYVSRGLISPLDFVFTSDGKEFWIWYTDLVDSTVSLYLQSASWKMHLPVETLISYNESSKFALSHGNEDIKGYLLEVNL